MNNGDRLLFDGLQKQIEQLATSNERAIHGASKGIRIYVDANGEVITERMKGLAKGQEQLIEINKRQNGDLKSNNEAIIELRNCTAEHTKNFDKLDKLAGKWKTWLLLLALFMFAIASLVRVIDVRATAKRQLEKRGIETTINTDHEDNN